MENYIDINYENNMKMLSLAIKYCKENFLHDDIIETLSSNNDLKKQICIIELKEIYSQKEADILVYNLTEKTTPIRECVSFKIFDLIQNPIYKQFFQTENILNIFSKSIIDINPSVSRNAVEIIKYTDNVSYIYENIIKEIKRTLSVINNERHNRSYVKNKQNFNLYWNLEAIVSIANRIKPKEELFEILEVTSASNDYTIREKTAKTLYALKEQDEKFKIMLEKFKEDNNLYVRKYAQINSQI